MASPYELLARLNQDGSIAGLSIRSLDILPSGRAVEGDPEPLTDLSDPAYAQFAADFSAAAVAERDALRSDRDSLAEQVATLTSERDSLAADKQALTAQLTDLQSQLDALVNPPVNPRHIAPFDFLKLFTDAEKVAIFSSIDPVVLLGRAQLQTIITYVDLDLADTVNLVGYLEQTGLIAAGRAAQILAREAPAV